LKDQSQAQQQMDILSSVMIRRWLPAKTRERAIFDGVLAGLNHLEDIDSAGKANFLQLANTHHVTVRALAVLERAAWEHGYDACGEWCASSLSAERGRIHQALEMLQCICGVLESEQCPVAVIKSLDHWPDLGSDLDLYTTADAGRVDEIMRTRFGATAIERSWGDRLAGKWNFQVPGLPELVEIHVRYLGQTGEHEAMARRIIERRILTSVDDRDFYVPAPEERILISTLQRVYRHFYFRLCDMVEMAALLNTHTVDFDELLKAADIGGIRPGVATFLSQIQSYIESYGGTVTIPPYVVASAYSRGMRVRFENGFLRIPKLPAAALYGTQLVRAGLRSDMRALCRLPLLPPLAVSALVVYHLAGDDKGIW